MTTTAPLRGWPFVERRMEQARERNRAARTPQDFAAVGEACAEALFLLAQAVYVLDREQFATKVEFRLGDSLVALLDRYISQRLTGPSRDAALASVAVANSQHAAGIRDAQGAALCLAATDSVITYLSISAGHARSQDTIKDLCDKFIAKSPDLGESQAYATARLALMPIGKRLASELTEEDVVNHARRRRNEGVSGATVTQDLTFLRAVIKAARDEWNMDVSTDPIDRAKRTLRAAGLIGQSAPRNRWPTREELQSLVDYFAEYEKHKRTRIPMRDIMEFALWSARRIGEICDLQWQDLDERKENCIVRVSDARGTMREHKFPLLGKARDIVMRQRPKDDDPRIFPYNAKSAGAAYTRAKAILGIENLRFQDLRREAAIRLYEAGHSIEQIAKVTGRIDLNTLLRDIGARPSPTRPQQTESKTALAADA